MVDYHRIIHDEQQVLECADILLHGQKPGQTRIMMILFRKKYDPEIAHIHRDPVPHTLVTSDNRDIFLSLISRYECRVGSYTHTRGTAPMSDKSLAMYMTLDAKSIIHGLHKTAAHFYELSLSGQNGEDAGTQFTERILHSNIHKSDAQGGDRYYDIDIDTKDPTLLEKVGTLLSPYRHIIKMAIETRGGYHVVLERRRGGVSIKSLYYYSRDSNVVEIKRDSMIPIPGTMQGGFPVRLISPNDILV